MLPDRARLLEDKGKRAATPPMEMSIQPLPVTPSRDDLPGRVLGDGTSGDAEFVLRAADTPEGTSLTVSPRTPYNGFILPLLSLSASIDRDGTTLDSVEPGDELRISVDLPPQMARYSGYETAPRMSDVVVTV